MGQLKTKRNLARLLGVSESAISKWMSSGVPDERVALFVEKTNVSFDELVAGLTHYSAKGAEDEDEMMAQAELQQQLEDMTKQIEMLRIAIEQLSERMDK